MAIQVSYTDSFGGTHSAAYVRVCAVRLHTTSSLTSPNATSVASIAELTDQVVVSIELYHDAAARSTSDSSARKEVIAQLDYVVSASDIATFFADSVLDDTGKSPLKQAYAYIKTQRENTSNQAGHTLNLTTGTTDV